MKSPATLLAAALVACSAGGATSSTDAGAEQQPTAEKRCGGATSTSRISIYSPEDIAKLADCTVLVGHVQEDSVTQLVDFSGLEKVRKIEGFLNLFRSPGFTSLHGLENLETIDGNLSIHLNPNLASLAALAKLGSVSGNLYISGNGALPQAEVDAFAARLLVGGTKTVIP